MASPDNGAMGDRQDIARLACLFLLLTVPTDRALAGWSPFPPGNYQVRAQW